MAIKIKFDTANNPEQPTIVLAKKNGDKLGVLNAKEIEVSDSLNDASEISFKIYKYLDGKKCDLWDEITNFKLAYCVEWNAWFEITVELDESDESVKTVFCTSLAHVELGQIMLYDIEINTEDDIAREEYKEPTILFNEKNPEASLLHRITEKAPHYKIVHVDSTIAKIQRTFSFDDTSIYDAFQDIAEEIECLFIFNSASKEDATLKRTISVYDLKSNCLDCGYRGTFTSVCPECGSTNIYEGYGNDTSILIASDDLADSIEFTTDTDSVKNCFKLEAGDDLMTATVRNCNPNGSDYIWHISDDMKKDMSEELVDKLESYDKDYSYYQKDHVVMAEENDVLKKYNALVDKYRNFNEDLEKISVPIKGYPSLMNAYYNTIDLELYLTSSMMPSVEMIETDAKKEAAKLTTANLSPVSVQSINVISNATADNAVLMMARLVVDSRFKTKIKSSSIVKGSASCTWTGVFEVTNYYDDEDTAESKSVNVVINDDYVSFVKQKIEKELSKEDDKEVDIVGLFEKDYSDFVYELKKYSLNRLISFHDACQACIDLLIEQGIADRKTWSGQDPNLYDDLYYPYMQKLNAISAEMNVREQEINVISGVYDSDGDLATYGLQNYFDEFRDEIQKKLDFQTYIGDELWVEFCSYKREDKYSNDNYISDGLNNKELFDKAQEFISVANDEILKSSEMQHSISTDLKNLLIIKKFEPIKEQFQVGNWLRIIVDDSLYKLRLINYVIDYDDIENITVEFSDVIKVKNSSDDIKSVLDQASSMATSYGYVARQAEQGKNGNDKLNGWVNEGLYLTNMKIVNDADNQNVSWDSHGILCKEYLPITDTYDDRQLKIINRGLYVTDDNWFTSRAGIGNFMFYNPKTKKNEEAYGVIADTLVGNLILSEEVGIYNKNNSITMDENGFAITTNADGSTADSIFTIQKEHKDADGDSTFEKLIYVDSEGNLSINGNVNISNSESQSITINDITDPNRVTIENNTAMQSFQMSIDGITSEVSKTNQTISDMGIEMSSMSSRIEQNTNSISAEVIARTEAVSGAVDEAKGYFDVKANELKLGVESDIKTYLGDNYYDQSYIDLLPNQIQIATEESVKQYVDDNYYNMTEMDSKINVLPGQIQLSTEESIKEYLGDNYYNKSDIDLLPDSITSTVMGNVEDGYVSKSVFQQTSEGFTASISSAQSTANTAKNTANTANSTANSAASAAKDAAKTATDYLSFSSSGLVISGKNSSYKARITSSSFDILNTSNVPVVSMGISQYGSFAQIRGNTSYPTLQLVSGTDGEAVFNVEKYDINFSASTSCTFTRTGHVNVSGTYYPWHVLYSNSSGTSGDVSLSSDVANFYYIILIYKDDMNSMSSTIVCNRYTTCYATLTSTRAKQDGLQVESKRVQLSGYSVTNYYSSSSPVGYYYGRVWFSSDASSWTYNKSANALKIVAVLGLRP